jgi:hypothetical protein
MLALAPASAQVSSPGITPAVISVDLPIPPGDEVRVPSLAVRNLGETVLTQRMSVRAAEGDSGAAIDWVRLDPVEFELEAGAAREVTVTIRVPRDAPEGSHRLLLQASTVPSATGSGLQLSVAVAVASVLEFGVGGEPVADETWLRYWPLLLTSAVVSGIVANRLAALADRLEWQSPIRRKRPPPEPNSDDGASD